MWLQALAAALRDRAPLEVIDTHAGAGVYDLGDAAVRRAGEARAGVARLLSDGSPPPAMRALANAVRTLNGGAPGLLYPGSPWLTAQALRPGDRLVACELRADDHGALAQALGARGEARLADGYAVAQAARPGVRRLALIDPPFERGDEALQVVATLRAVLHRGEPAVVWLPLKDLDGLDRILTAVEALRPPPSLAAQVRLRPLDDPLRLNGCALLLLDLEALEPVAAEITGYVAALCGEPGAAGKVDRFGG